jgi:RimJ/RimL family protein N-acetyltransferase
MNTDIFDLFPEYQTDRLRLRVPVLSDIPYMFNFYSSARAMTFIPKDVFIKMSQAEKRFYQFDDGFKKKECLWWAIDLKSTEETIGFGGFFDISKEDNKTEIGYGIIEKYWGHGFVSEAVEAIVKYGVEKVGFHRIYGHIVPGNNASIRILEKNKFKFEGCQKDNRFAQGKYFDINTYALLTNDN